jgi:nucleolar protein 16
LTQNYQRLGLLHKLNAPTGGKERLPIQGENPENSLQITGSGNTSQQLELGETRVERDPETGRILRVISDEEQIEVAGRKRNAANPLNDPLNDLSDNEAELSPAQASVIVQQLERQADREGQAAKNKKPRYLSQREVEWITRLVEKHGDNLPAMVRDRKLNPMQQTEGDLRRRINQLKESQQ